MKETVKLLMEARDSLVRDIERAEEESVKAQQNLQRAEEAVQILHERRNEFDEAITKLG